MELHSFGNKNNYKFNSCIVCIVLMIVVFTVITIYFIYYIWSLTKDNISCIKFNTHKKTET